MKITQTTNIETIRDYIKPFKSRGEVPLSCSRCGKLFTTRKKDITDMLSKFLKGDRQSTLLFCSRTCSGTTTTERLGGGSKEVTCDHCGVSFVKLLSQIRKSPNNFCSHSCSATFNNAKPHPTRSKGTCDICGEVISASRRFCVACREQGRHLKPPKPHDSVKEMRRLSTNAYRKKRKQEYLDYLGGVCSSCGYSKSTWSLEFHHIDPSSKLFTISRAINTHMDKDAVLAELDKCIVLCSNCHGELHENEYKNGS